LSTGASLLSPSKPCEMSPMVYIDPLIQTGFPLCIRYSVLFLIKVVIRVPLKNRKGQSMVELALVLPVLLMLICGIIEFGWIFSNKILANNACREAARYAAVHFYDDGLTAIQTYADSIAVGYNSDFDTAIPMPAGEQITVNLDGKIPLLTPFFNALLESDDGDGCYDLSAQCTMRIE